jgi:hypothetical protein
MLKVVADGTNPSQAESWVGDLPSLAIRVCPNCRAIIREWMWANPE